MLKTSDRLSILKCAIHGKDIIQINIEEDDNEIKQCEQCISNQNKCSLSTQIIVDKGIEFNKKLQSESFEFLIEQQIYSSQITNEYILYSTLQNELNNNKKEQLVIISPYIINNNVVDHSQNQKKNRTIKNQYDKVILQSNSLQKNTQDQQQLQQKNKNNKLHKQHRIKQYYELDKIILNNVCYAMDFNYDETIMIIGCGKSIKIYQINSNNITEINSLNEHNDRITCLIYSKKFNWIMSGSSGKDNTIKLWKKQENNEWICNTNKNGHNSWINCLITNKNEDLLFSASWDQSIIIWSINYSQNSIQYEYTLHQHNKGIFQITLNDNEDTLLSTSQDNLIIIWKQNDDKKYCFFQQIKNEHFGSRINFINQTSFIWLQNNNGRLKYYQLNQNNKYEENQKLFIQLKNESKDIEYYFPCYFNQQQQTLYIKHNKQIFLINYQNIDQIIINYQIECQTNQFYGVFSKSGKFIAFWNKNTKELILNQLILQ